MTGLEWFEHLLAQSLQERDQSLSSLALTDPALASKLKAMLEADDKLQDMPQTPAPTGLFLEALASSTLPVQFVPIELLGHGGMGEVWRATREIAGETQQIAVKLLRLDVNSESMQARFIREQRALLKLEHPHIARLYDAGVSESGRPWLAMELVEGSTITQHCDARKLNIRERLVVFRQVLAAVQYAHDRLIVHRDIKPDNVFVTETGQVKLLDFGIAKSIALEDNSAQASHTQAFFSAYAAAPEQLSGQAISVGTDIYALCGLLYDLLCGKAIFKDVGQSTQELHEAILHQSPALPSGLVDQNSAELRNAPGAGELANLLRGDLDRICLHGLRKLADERYASVRALEDDIAAYLENRPVAAVGQHWRYRTRKWLRRNWLLAGVSTFGLISAIVFVSLLTLRGNALARANAVAIAEKQSAMAARQRAEQAQSAAEQVNGFLIDVFKRADPMTRAIGDKSLATLVEASFAEVRARKKIPSETVPVMLALVDALVSLGQVQNAKPLLQELTTNVPLNLDQQQQATLIRANIALFEQRGDELASLLAAIDPQVLKQISQVSFFRFRSLQGHLAFLRNDYLQTLQLTDDLDLQPDVLRLRIKSLARLKRFSEVDSLVQLANRTFGNAPIELISLHDLMAGVSVERKNYREAHEYAKTAYELSKQVNGEGNSRTLRHHNDYGLSLLRIGRFNQARDELTKALQTAKAQLEPDDPRLKFIAYNIVLCDAKLGNLTEHARAQLLQATGKKSLLGGKARALLIRVAYIQGKLSEFHRMLREARSELAREFWDPELVFWDAVARSDFASDDIKALCQTLFEFDPILNARFARLLQTPMGDTIRSSSAM